MGISMKFAKLIGCTAAAAAIFTVASGFAEANNSYTPNYDPAESRLTVNSDGKSSTAIIYKADSVTDTEYSDSDVIYMGQASGGFGASVDFMLKKAPADGLYIVSLGGSGTPDIGYLRIGGMSYENDTAAEPVNRDSYTENGETLYKKGFSLTSNAEYRSLKLVENGNIIGGVSLDTPHITGEGSITYGIQIYAIPAQSVDALTVYLSEDEIATD